VYSGGVELRDEALVTFIGKWSGVRRGGGSTPSGGGRKR
jgi:hypothetical protein